jgi:ubiquitin carboxyl-terminal hydrolase 9/13
MEAMLKEQEAEERQQAKARTSEAGTAPEGPLSPTNLYHTQTVTDPPHEYLDHMKPLAHAFTAPVSPPSNMRQTSDYIPPMPNINPVLPPKSKKEIKAEEKERKAAQKAEEKAQVEARSQRRRRGQEARRGGSACCCCQDRRSRKVRSTRKHELAQ